MFHLATTAQHLFGYIAAALTATSTGCGTTKDNPLYTSIAFVGNILAGAGAVAVFVAFVWSGYLFLTASGNPQEMEKAKTALRNAVIGAIIIFGGWTIASNLQSLANGVGGPFNSCPNSISIHTVIVSFF